jgi:hypothetical protein
MGWWQTAQAAVWPNGVVVKPPFGQDRSGVGERAEQRLVEQRLRKNNRAENSHQVVR